MGNEELKARVVFEVAYKNPKYNSLGIKIKMGDKEPWATAASEAVFLYAKNNFQKEEVVDIIYVLTEAGKIKIIRILKVKDEPTPESKPETPNSNTHLTNLPVVGKVKTTKDGNFRSPEQITKDETMKAVAIHMASLAGRITLENQVEAINVAYETYYRNTTKER